MKIGSAILGLALILDIRGAAALDPSGTVPVKLVVFYAGVRGQAVTAKELPVQ